MGLLKFLFFTLLAFWFVGLILRSTVSRWLRKRTEEYNRAAAAARKEASRKNRREGDVTIEGSGAKVSRRVNQTVGEYVEFEEIKP